MILEMYPFVFCQRSFIIRDSVDGMLQANGRLVELIAAQIPCLADEQIFKHTTVQSKWFNSPANTFLGIANTPDIVNISQNGQKVTLFEVSCAFDLFMEDSYCSKILKYQSLISTVENLGYKCQLIVLVFGSLGHVHRLAIRGLCIGGLSKTRAKQLAKYCSISATIGSMFIWKRRCFLYPLNCIIHNNVLICFNLLDYSKKIDS